MSRPPSDPQPGRRPEGSPDGRPPSPTPSGSSSGWIRYLPWVLVLLLVSVFFIPGLSGGSSDSKKLSYSAFIKAVESGQVDKVEYNKSNGDINGDYTKPVNGADSFTADGPNDNLPDSTLESARGAGRHARVHERPAQLLPRQHPPADAAGADPRRLLRVDDAARPSQATGLMNIGRSRAKVYTTEKPKTTFDDVAGYGR